MSDLDDMKRMFKSGNNIPVTRVTITLDQFERIAEMHDNQMRAGEELIAENRQLRFDNAELKQERDRLLEVGGYLSHLARSLIGNDGQILDATTCGLARNYFNAWQKAMDREA